MNRKVLGVGDTSTVDFFIVNRVDLKGNYDLQIKAIAEESNVMLTKTIPVSITGGIVYGELIAAGLPIVATRQGYTIVTAQILKNGKPVAYGDDRFYAVSLNTVE